ncbi:MAG TPA: MbtH family NRPS accessory protein [Labilithrix sp.]|nr:MbtH family NRPS accessory protein [Labilithrix sp.]
MNSDSSDDAVSYQVLVNDEEQYSIWPSGREIPKGWRGTGTVGSKAHCLETIGKVWTDMRPLSLRRAMARSA